MRRRDFNKMATLGLVANASFFSTQASKSRTQTDRKVPLGLCNHSLRGMRLKARKLIEYAIEHRLDSVQFNTLQTFESLEPDYLKELSGYARSHDVSIYVGAGSICETSARFSDRYGDAGATLDLGIRVAAQVGSPIVGVRIGNLDDRYSGGGIKPKVDRVIDLMETKRGAALDANVKFAFENHAGDLRCEELLDLIIETGTDICGAFFDPGNAIWTMEDPMRSLQLLGEHIVGTSVRDVMVWETDDGAAFQWTAIGEGLMDYRFYTDFLAEKCPGVPLHVETISNSQRPIPFLTSDFWKGFPDLPATGITDFLKLLRRGQALEIDLPPDGVDKRTFDIEHQQAELQKSLGFLRGECGAGLKS